MKHKMALCLSATSQGLCKAFFPGEDKSTNTPYLDLLVGILFCRLLLKNHPHNAYKRFPTRLSQELKSPALSFCPNRSEQMHNNNGEGTQQVNTDTFIRLFSKESDDGNKT